MLESSSMGALNRSEETTIINSPALASPASSTSSIQNPFPSSKSYDSNSPSFRFRRHSSQSSISQISNVNKLESNSNLPSPLTVSSSCSGGAGGGDRSICSSPSLKMSSSRLHQIKIDEGIELHLNREIKSECETQSTLKLKASCEELMLHSDEFDGYSFDSSNRNNTPSPSQVNSGNNNNNPNNSSTFRRYRTFSESLNNNPTMTNVTGTTNINQMASPSMSSFHSYSNSSSPTADLVGREAHANSSNHLLLRCFSPCSTNRYNNSSNSGCQNYFSKSPSPTRKLFVPRRSMSPVPSQFGRGLRPESLNTLNNGNSKRKYCDVDSNDSMSAVCSPKRFNNDSQSQSTLQHPQEFVEPLQIFTGNNNNNANASNLMQTSNRSTTSSASSPALSSPLSTTPTSSVSTVNNLLPNQTHTFQPSSHQKSFSSLIITAQNNNFYHNKSNNSSSSNSNSNLMPANIDTPNEQMITTDKFDNNNVNNKNTSNSGSFALPKLSTNNSDRQNKYTFIPIQIPGSPSPSSASTASSFSYSLPSQNLAQQTPPPPLPLSLAPLQNKRLTAVLSTTSTTLTSNSNNSANNCANSGSFFSIAQNNTSTSISPSNTATTTTTTAPNIANSPISYICDSPISYSPSVSIVSVSSVSVDKPDSGYQSSAQNNSDSESCI